MEYSHRLRLWNNFDLEEELSLGADRQQLNGEAKSLCRSVHAIPDLLQRLAIVSHRQENNVPFVTTAQRLGEFVSRCMAIWLNTLRSSAAGG